jgi:hypothetical protein
MNDTVDWFEEREELFATYNDTWFGIEIRIPADACHRLYVSKLESATCSQYDIDASELQLTIDASRSDCYSVAAEEHTTLKSRLGERGPNDTVP